MSDDLTAHNGQLLREREKVIEQANSLVHLHVLRGFGYRAVLVKIPVVPAEARGLHLFRHIGGEPVQILKLFGLVAFNPADPEDLFLHETCR